MWTKYEKNGFYWKLVAKVVPQGEASINGGLWKRGGHSKFRESMIVKEKGVQTFAQSVVCGELYGHQPLSGSNLVVIDIQIAYDGNVITK